MAQVLLFHHVQGLTPGVVAFADALRSGGHDVVTPDLYDGAIFDSIESGFAHMKGLGSERLDDVADAAADSLTGPVVFGGFSLGVRWAQRFAQFRANAVGALLYEACFPVAGPDAFGPWPGGLPAQVHGMDDDEFFAHEGDVDAARGLVEAAGPGAAELFVYPGNRHLFTDASLPSYDAEATALVQRRSLDLLDRL